MKPVYIQLYSIHGLMRGHELELGRNADSGGQLKYVIELLRSLSKLPEVRKVDLMTRLIVDKSYAEDYSNPIEIINDKARIVRIQCGGRRYIRKEKLWGHLDEYVDKTLRFIKKENEIPDIIHGHYADGGYIASELSSLLGIPFIFTGHSLGIPKKERLSAGGLSEKEMERRYHINKRILVEKEIIIKADRIITSTHQEIDKQYGLYTGNLKKKFNVIPPGIDITRFRPFYEDNPVDDLKEYDYIEQARFSMENELNRFFREPHKALILTLARPDKKKNISGLVEAYGSSRELQAMANLAVFAGLRRDISQMDENESEVLTELLLLMDKYDLYGHLAIPKRHDFEYEVPELYRIAARSQGVFVNPAFTEPFGLTLIEAAASGLPVVTTDDGGPRDILQNCENGILVDSMDTDEIIKGIKELIADPFRWKKCSQNGVRGVHQHYTWKQHCRRYMETIKKLPLDTPIDLSQRETPRQIGRRLASIKRLFITDIDNTLLGDDDALSELLKILKKNTKTIGFGVASGRTPELALEVLRKNGIQDPDVIIGSVGTEIYYGPLLKPDNGWRTHISANWNPKRIRKVLLDIPDLREQPPETQREFKISYFLEGEKAQLRLQKIHAKLGEAGLKYNLIYSSGKHLDILPYRASKGKAIRYLHYKWRIALNKILTSGDSGNDSDMLRGEILGVVVSNHQPDLDKLKGLSNVYFAKKACAGGIIEGMRHYGLIDK